MIKYSSSNKISKYNFLHRLKNNVILYDIMNSTIFSTNSTVVIQYARSPFMPWLIFRSNALSENFIKSTAI